MIGTREGSLVELSLVLTIGPPLEPTNNESMIPSKLLGEPLGLWFGYEVFRCQYH